MTVAATTSQNLPRVGMMATVRNRRGIISSVQEYSAGVEGTLHLVTVDYTDTDGVPDEQLLWEREPHATIVPPHALPNVLNDSPMSGREYDALLRATRWNAITPFLAPDGSDQLAATPISAPFYGAVQVEDFQLVPLLKALRMPRVSLLLADDVGLGKTIEAGLILNELLIRRRIRRVLILCPAALRDQWRQEMQDKFSLGFDIVDRDETHNLKKRMGMDANPWRIFPRAIASYYYLRQPNVLEEFRAACNPDADGPTRARMPWDLIIVDEAHNLMPANFGEDSDLAKMLGMISPWFEHKLFLTATPHNGHTRCFTGLLEQLDSSRFQRTSELTDDVKSRIDQIVVRRLKGEINELDDERGRSRRFAERDLHGLEIAFGPEERALSSAFANLRRAIKQRLRSGSRGEQLAGEFAVEVLNKRLLSGPTTFADSWLRFLDGLSHEEAVQLSDVTAARRLSLQDLDDDLEIESRVDHAAHTTGAWLRAMADELESEIAAVTDAVRGLRIERDARARLTPPVADARYEALKSLIDESLRSGSKWRDDERLIIFTEYKTTLDYLTVRLRKDYDDPEKFRVRELYGGMSRAERETIKRAFNDATDPVRILVATDAASEGLNLQETARHLLHYDIPWNPSRLEQRNGRLDRHGQGRDVQVFHFDSRDDADIGFMSRVVRKVHSIREDLGSMGEVFESAFQQYFADQENAERAASNMEANADRTRASVERVQSNHEEDLLEEAAYIDDFRADLDLTPRNLAETLEVALAMTGELPRLRGPDDEGRYRLIHPVPSDWRDLIDDTLRHDVDDRARVGALPELAFDADAMVEQIGKRKVFRHSKDTVLMHLGHPIFRQALARFARARFPNAGSLSATRWIARSGEVPDGAEALVLLTVEELAINE
ncbi:MAG: DISARM system SNF2-like helicase DrmD, partial [Bradymonadaceae bacterium]